MDENTRKKTEAFLQWYQDLYDGAWYAGNMPEPVEANEQSSAPRKATVKPNPELLNFHQQIKDCPKCSLCKTRTKFVFGDGNGHADIMFVGEAPGRDEDLQGIPFVGRAGKLLNRMLGQINLERGDVYIANILKCRPPNNRDPLPAEVNECIPYLHKQIELIQPKIMIALGRVAAQNLLQNKNTLGSMRKKVWHYRDIPMIVTYHPAYILRNMSALDEGVNDLRFALETANKSRS